MAPGMPGPTCGLFTPKKVMHPAKKSNLTTRQGNECYVSSRKNTLRLSRDWIPVQPAAAAFRRAARHPKPGASDVAPSG
jgi:hypothetical protein